MSNEKVYAFICCISILFLIVPLFLDEKVLIIGFMKTVRRTNCNREGKPKIIWIPKESVAIQGETCSIPCKAKSCYKDTLNYQWFDPQQRDLSKVRGFSVDGGLLTISNVSQNSKGQYKCRVIDEDGIDEASFRLEVQIRPRIVQLKNLTMRENDVATLECKAEGFPKPNVTMWKDNAHGSLQDGDRRFRMTEYDKSNLRISFLIIASVKRSDDGLFFCKASNDAGDVIKAGHLEVRFKPDMSLTLSKIVKAWYVNPINLTCIAEANPKASLVWKFRGIQIDNWDDRYQIFGKQSQSNLLVRTHSTAHEVFGEYTCEAENNLGKNSTIITLEKASIPGPVAQIAFDRVASSTISFLITEPEVTGGLPITNYIMMCKLLSDPLEKEFTVDWTKGSLYILSDLKPGNKYQFSICARNDVGEGPWRSTQYTMPEGTPPMTPTITNITFNSNEYFEVWWEEPDDNGEPITELEVRLYEAEKGISGLLVQVGNVVKITVTELELTSRIKIDGLLPCKLYEIELTAKNKIGKSLPAYGVIRSNCERILLKDNQEQELSKNGQGKKPYNRKHRAYSYSIFISIVFIFSLISLRCWFSRSKASSNKRLVCTEEL